MKFFGRLMSAILAPVLVASLTGCLPEPPDPIGKKLWQAISHQGQQDGGGPGQPGGYPAGPVGGGGATPQVSGNTGSRLSGAQASAVVAEHNRARAEVGVAPLVWSNELSGVAQRWADRLASSGKFEHSGDRRYGENLAWSSVQGMDPVQGVRMWYAEKRDYRGGVIRSGGSAKTGHYTQMVWRGTTAVGCGVATGRNGTVVVCNYGPPGNIVGQSPY